MSKAREGVYGIGYHHGRQTKRALKYRLARRADEVVRLVKRLASHDPCCLLDLGTADGMMLQRMLGGLNTSFAVGADLSLELLSVIEHPAVRPVQANGVGLPFSDGTFDLVVATAVIEHVSDPIGMLRECRRVLAPRGLVVITTPDPFWERIATAVGHLPDEGHQKTLNLDRMRVYLKRADLELQEAYKFMASPWGLPAELVIESVMRTLGFSFILLNQIAVGRRPAEGSC